VKRSLWVDEKQINNGIQCGTPIKGLEGCRSSNLLEDEQEISIHSIFQRVQSESFPVNESSSFATWQTKAQNRDSLS
jgi:hypothetical protein